MRAKIKQRSKMIDGHDVTTSSNVENFIDKFTYESAQKYYKDLRIKLFNYLSEIAGKETATLFIDTLTSVIEEQLAQKTTKGGNVINDIVYKQLPNKLEKVIYEDLESNQGNIIIEQAKQEYLQLKNSDDKKAREKINKILNQVVDELGETNRLVTFIKRKIKLNKNAVDFNDIKAQLPAFQRSVIKSYFETGQKGGGSKGGNLATVSGYIAESVIADAIYNYLQQLEIRPRDFTAKQAGSLKINGRDTPYDILFGDIFGKNENQLKEEIQKMNGVLDIDNSLQTFGIQSKRASLATRFTYKRDSKLDVAERRLLKKYQGTSTAFKIGNRENLVSGFVNRYGESSLYHWTTGIEFLSSLENVKEVLGSGNVMWVAGKEAMWTDHFIKNFVDNRMRLNFEFLINEDAYKGNNLIVLAYHNENLRSSIMNKS